MNGPVSWEKASTEEKFESALHFLARGSMFGAKVSSINEFASALNFAASGSVIGANSKLLLILW